MANETLQQIISRKEAKALGLSRYFTGVPCPYRHVCQRRTSGSNCLDCEKAWFAKNSERISRYKANWQNQNIEITRKRRLDWWRRNAEEQKLKQRDRINADIEAHRAKRRAIRRRSPERFRAYFRKYRNDHIEEIRANHRNAKAKRKAAPGSHTAADIRRLFLVQENKCSYCFVDLSAGHHVDHVIPLARGGTNNPDNLCLACPPCNTSKQDLTGDEFRERLSRYS